MRMYNFLTATTVLFMLGLTSCKKDSNSSSSSSTEISSTVELGTDNAISDNLNADAENILNQAAIDKNFSGSTPVGINSPMGNLPACATVTVSPASGFPKNIAIVTAEKFQFVMAKILHAIFDNNTIPEVSDARNGKSILTIYHHMWRYWKSDSGHIACKIP